MKIAILEKMKFAALILFCFACIHLPGQSITLQEATSQNWAGGQCCTQGINYVFTLQPDAKTQTFKLDTLWIGESAFVPDPPGPQLGQVQYQFDSLAGTYQIFAGQSWGDYGIDWEMPVLPSKPARSG
jgi:hypothetical protein